MPRQSPLPQEVSPSRATLASGSVVAVDPLDMDLLLSRPWRAPKEERQHILCRTPAAERRESGLPSVIYLQRMIAERIAGRPLTKDEFVRMVDGDRLNLRRSNLAVVSRAEFYRLIDCPVTPGRLAELYAQPLSIADLRTHLAGYLEGKRRPSQKVVQDWLRAAGITERTTQEAQRVWRKLKPDRAAIATRAFVASRKVGGNGDQLRDKRNRKKLVKALRPIWQATHVTCTCSWCGATFDRQGCLVRRAERQGQLMYCGKPCSAKATALKRWTERVTGGGSQRAEETPEWLREAMQSQNEGNYGVTDAPK